MKNKHTWHTAAIILLCATNLALASDSEREGHGGVSIVCRDADEKIESVELLDIFEGNHQYGLEIKDRTTSFDEQIEQAQTRLVSRPELLEEFQNELAYVHANIQFPSEEVGLNPTDDAFPVINKKGCAYKQLAVYTNDNQVLVDAELYNKLSETGKAGLYIHEVIFKMARARGATSSVTSRKLVAYLLARPHNPKVIKKLLSSMFSAPKPKLPSTFSDTSAGRYTHNDRKLCDFKIHKNSKRGKMIFELIHSGARDVQCEAPGVVTELVCDEYKCEGNRPYSNTVKFRIVPVSPDTVVYLIGRYKNGKFYYSDKLLSTRY